MPQRTEGSARRAVRVGSSLAVLAAAAVFGTTLTAAPASADPCPSGALCAYTQYDWGGAPGPVYDDNTNLLQYTKFANAASLYNNGKSCNVTVYYNTGYRAPAYNLNRGTGWRRLGSNLYHHVGSNRWCLY
ncbi:peptidase inhibitor family I36 protein [Micromonospora echinofusca]|uniref:peptidase inhibitor family I36 protein n=1 Tax=Micromonospora echinofusca TaxID=47858 RepID=UPI00342EB11E